MSTFFPPPSRLNPSEWKEDVRVLLLDVSATTFDLTLQDPIYNVFAIGQPQVVYRSTVIPAFGYFLLRFNSPFDLGGGFSIASNNSRVSHDGALPLPLTTVPLPNVSQDKIYTLDSPRFQAIHRLQGTITNPDGSVDGNFQSATFWIPMHYLTRASTP